ARSANGARDRARPAARGPRRGHRRARPDDVRLPGRRRDPGLRAAARPRAPRPQRAAPCPGRRGARPARRRHVRRLRELWPADRAGAAGGDPVRRPLHRLPADGGSRLMSVAANPGLVSIDDVRAAARRLEGAATRPSLVPFAAPARRGFLKAESLQPIGAFKIRGAYNAVATLPPDERARGVITYSSGNHAQGVARAARLPGAPCVVVMPSDAPTIKRERVAADGAEIVVVGTASDERQAGAERTAAERGLAIIPPFDDDRIIAGQGTIGLEIVEALPDVAAVLVPIGGGGVPHRRATAVRSLAPGSRLVGVEPELAADAKASLEAGEI